MTGIDAVFSFSFNLFIASNPSISGILMSSKIKSGTIFSIIANILSADGIVLTR
jgi:hypothetical protein